MIRWKDKLITTDDKKKLLTNSGAYFLLGCSIIAMTFFGICSPKNAQEGFSFSGNAAKVGSEKVTLQEFQRAYNNAKERMQQQYQEAFDPVAMQLPKYVMRQLVDERVSHRAAIDLGIEGQEEDVVKLLQDAKAFRTDKGAFDPEAFQRYLKYNGYNEASFSNDFRRNVGVQNYRQFVSKTTYVSKKSAALEHKLGESKIEVEFIKIEASMAKVAIGDDEVKAFLNDAGKAKVKTYFEGHPTEFNTKEKVKARHILISYTGARNASGAGALRVKADAKKVAEDVLKQVKTPGADFAKIATTSTDEGSGKSRGGDLGFFSREDMVKEFSDAAFAMKAGDISGIVESPFGFHIIKVEEKQDAKNIALEAATDQIARKLIKEEKAPKLLQERAEKMLATLKEKGSVDADLKELGAKWESTGSLPATSTNFGALGSDQSTVEEILKLQNPGDLIPKVIDNRGTKYIAKLKMKNLGTENTDEKKRQELAESASSSAGYAILQNYEKSIKKELEDKGRIWENPDLLSLGQKKTASSSSGEDDSNGSY
jgi:peptidyl-prolyl cis-trans isomerase D